MDVAAADGGGDAGVDLKGRNCTVGGPPKDDLREGGGSGEDE